MSCRRHGAAFLRERGIECVHILGLATDYCVKFTALDAADLGFRTVVIEDGCRGIDAKAGDVARALAELKSAGVEISQSHDVRAAYAR